MIDTKGQTGVRGQKGVAQAPQDDRLPHQRAGESGERPRQPKRRRSRCVSPVPAASAQGLPGLPQGHPTLGQYSAGCGGTQSWFVNICLYVVWMQFVLCWFAIPTSLYAPLT